MQLSRYFFNLYQAFRLDSRTFIFLFILRFLAHDMVCAHWFLLELELCVYRVVLRPARVVLCVLQKPPVRGNHIGDETDRKSLKAHDQQGTRQNQGLHMPVCSAERHIDRSEERRVGKECRL